MNILRPVVFFLFMSLIFIEIPAETAGKPDNTILFNCAYSNDSQLQLMALNSLKAKVTGEVNLDEKDIQILVDLSNRSLLIDNNGKETNIIVSPEVRIKAMGILGEVGGQKSLNAISDILRSSNDSIILIEAVKSSNTIVADDYRYFINTLSTVMKKQHSLFRDNGFANTALTAIDSVTSKTGNILTSEILGLMMLYSEGEYSQEVKDYSRHLLKVILTER